MIQQVDGNGAQVNSAYDAMGRVSSRTNPFPAGGTPGPATSFSYDALGRATVVTLPDSQTVQTSYNGNAVTVTDQVKQKDPAINRGPVKARPEHSVSGEIAAYGIEADVLILVGDHLAGRDANRRHTVGSSLGVINLRASRKEERQQRDR